LRLAPLKRKRGAVSNRHVPAVPARHQQKKECAMNIHLSIGPLLALIAGILILAMPRLLNYIVALYLILVGIVGLFGFSHIV
jgi:hypothetical protein